MKEVIAYAHTHWDREWYREFEEFRLRLVEVVDRILDDLVNGRLNSFYFDGQTAAIEDYLEIYPDKFPLIKQLIKEKKLFIGPFYCLSDVFLVNSELLIRNLEIGIEKSKEFGCNNFIGYLADTFGHSKGLVTILNYFKIKNIFMWRGLPDTPSEFKWCGLNAINLQRGYFQNVFSLNISAEEKAKILEKELALISQNSGATLLLPIGGDHLAVPKNLKTQITEVNKHLKNYKIKLGNPFEYLKKVENNFVKEFDCEFLDNNKTFLLKSVYSSRIYLKQRNAYSQWLLSRLAEPLQALTGANYQKQIDYAYKTLIKNHAHDSIYGCSTDKVHREMLTRFDKVDEIANGIVDRIKTTFADGGNDFSIVNLSNYTFSGAVKIKTTAKIKNAQLIGKYKGFPDEKLYNVDDVPITEDYTNIYEYLVDVKNIPPFSICPIEHFKGKSSLQINENSISNANVELQAKNGSISITDKKNKKTYNDILSIVDRADVGDSYNFGALQNDKPVYAKLVKTKILQKGNVQSILRLEYEIKIPEISTNKGRSKKLKTHKLFVDAILQNQSEFVEFSIKWKNLSKNHILQVGFNLPNKVNKVLSEDTQGVILREFDPDYDIYEQIPAPRGKEIKTNTAPFQRFAQANGFCVITKGLQEYEVEKNTFKITILRSTGVISNPQNSMRGTPAGPPIETPELQCLGECSANFAVCFTKNVDEMYKNTEFFYNPTLYLKSTLNKQLLTKIDFDKYFVQAVKINKYPNLQVRLVNKKTFEITNVQE